MEYTDEFVVGYDANLRAESLPVSATSIVALKRVIEDQGGISLNSLMPWQTMEAD